MGKMWFGRRPLASKKEKNATCPSVKQAKGRKRKSKAMIPLGDEGRDNQLKKASYSTRGTLAKKKREHKGNMVASQLHGTRYLESPARAKRKMWLIEMVSRQK